MISTSDIETLPGTTVIDTDGDRVGAVGQVYVSDDGSEPLFVTVKTGLFGLKESFIPLQGADLTQDGLRVGFDKQVIKDAPRIDADQQISEAEQSTLFDYYEQRSTVGGGTAARPTRRAATSSAPARPVPRASTATSTAPRAPTPRAPTAAAPRAPSSATTRTGAAPSATTPAARPPTTP